MTLTRLIRTPEGSATRGVWRRRLVPATRRFAAPCALALALVLFPAAGGAQGILDTKVEMLLNLAKFVEWPRSAVATEYGQMTVAVLGEDEMAAQVAAVLSTRSISGRRVFVRCVRRAQDARDCQILFIASSESQRIPELLEALQGRSVLTIADAPGFAAQGGMVDFVQDGDRVRFEINTGSAQRAQIRISAKLLALARIVPQVP